jgi:hypothetical protein
MSEEREESAQRHREAAEAYLGGRKVEAAGVFQREGQGIEWVDPVVFWPFRFFERLFDNLTKGRVGQLPRKFLLAVTTDEVYVFQAWDWRSKTPTLHQIAVFGRDEIRLRRTPGKEDAVVYLSATERGRTRQIALDAEPDEQNPAAADVVAALSE